MERLIDGWMNERMDRKNIEKKTETEIIVS